MQKTVDIYQSYYDKNVQHTNSNNNNIDNNKNSYRSNPLSNTNQGITQDISKNNYSSYNNFIYENNDNHIGEYSINSNQSQISKQNLQNQGNNQYFSIQNKENINLNNIPTTKLQNQKINFKTNQNKKIQQVKINDNPSALLQLKNKLDSQNSLKQIDLLQLQSNIGYNTAQQTNNYNFKSKISEQQILSTREQKTTETIQDLSNLGAYFQQQQQYQQLNGNTNSTHSRQKKSFSSNNLNQQVNKLNNNTNNCHKQNEEKEKTIIQLNKNKTSSKQLQNKTTKLQNSNIQNSNNHTNIDKSINNQKQTQKKKQSFTFTNGNQFKSYLEPKPTKINNNNKNTDNNTSLANKLKIQLKNCSQKQINSKNNTNQQQQQQQLLLQQQQQCSSVRGIPTSSNFTLNNTNTCKNQQNQVIDSVINNTKKYQSLTQNSDTQKSQQNKNDLQYQQQQQFQNYFLQQKKQYMQQQNSKQNLESNQQSSISQSQLCQDMSNNSLKSQLNTQKNQENIQKHDRKRSTALCNLLKQQQQNTIIINKNVQNDSNNQQQPKLNEKLQKTEKQTLGQHLRGKSSQASIYTTNISINNQDKNISNNNLNNYINSQQRLQQKDQYQKKQEKSTDKVLNINKIKRQNKSISYKPQRQESITCKNDLDIKKEEEQLKQQQMCKIYLNSNKFRDDLIEPFQDIKLYKESPAKLKHYQKNASKSPINLRNDKQDSYITPTNRNSQQQQQIKNKINSNLNNSKNIPTKYKHSRSSSLKKNSPIPNNMTQNNLNKSINSGSQNQKSKRSNKSLIGIKKVGIDIQSISPFNINNNSNKKQNNHNHKRVESELSTFSASKQKSNVNNNQLNSQIDFLIMQKSNTYNNYNKFQDEQLLQSGDSRSSSLSCLDDMKLNSRFMLTKQQQLQQEKKTSNNNINNKSVSPFSNHSNSVIQNNYAAGSLINYNKKDYDTNLNQQQLENQIQQKIYYNKATTNKPVINSNRSQNSNYNNNSKNIYSNKEKNKLLNTNTSCENTSCLSQENTLSPFICHEQLSKNLSSSHLYNKQQNTVSIQKLQPQSLFTVNQNTQNINQQQIQPVRIVEFNRSSSCSSQKNKYNEQNQYYTNNISDRPSTQEQNINNQINKALIQQISSFNVESLNTETQDLSTDLQNFETLVRKNKQQQVQNNKNIQEILKVNKTLEDIQSDFINQNETSNLNRSFNNIKTLDFLDNISNTKQNQVLEQLPQIFKGYNEHAITVEDESKEQEEDNDEDEDDHDDIIKDSVQRSQDPLYKVDPTALDKQNDVNSMMRVILLDWMMEVSMEFMMKRDTYYQAISYVDKYISEDLNIEKQNLQLVGVVALYISAKMEEVFPPSIQEFVKSTDNGYSEQQILAMELQMYKILQWRINPVTYNFWLSFYCQKWDLSTPYFIQKYQEQYPEKAQLLVQEDIQYRAQQSKSYIHYRIACQILDTIILDFDNYQYIPQCIIGSILYLYGGILFGVFEIQTIYTEFPTSSYYLFQPQFKYYNDFFNSFLVHNYGCILLDLQPTIQYVSTFFDIQFQYDLPRGAEVLDQQTEHEKNYEEFISFQPYYTDLQEYIKNKPKFI